LGYILGDFFANASGHPANIHAYQTRNKWHFGVASVAEYVFFASIALVVNRVTSLGEFSRNGRLFSLGTLFENFKSSILCYFPPKFLFCINCDK
jgi:hypothetical protein